MSNSWGHAIRRLTEPEAEQRARHGQTCTGRCVAPATYATTYSYVTGQAGRVSWAERYACDEHAARFAAKHGLSLPAEPIVGPVHASDAAVRQAFGEES
jgi:hypothetical protein